MFMTIFSLLPSEMQTLLPKTVSSGEIVYRVLSKVSCVGRGGAAGPGRMLLLRMKEVKPKFVQMDNVNRRILKPNRVTFSSCGCLHSWFSCNQNHIVLQLGGSGETSLRQFLSLGQAGSAG